MYKIPGNRFNGEINFTYMSLHELYDRLYIKWLTCLHNRDLIEDRQIGGDYMEHCSSILDHLVHVAIQCNLFDSAFSHIIDFKATDLKNQISFQNAIKSICENSRCDREWITKAFRYLSSGTNIDPELICYSLQDLNLIIKSYARPSMDVVTMLPTLGDSKSIPEIAVAFWYDANECIAYLYTPLFFRIEKVLRFKTINTSRIEEWNQRLHDESMGIDSPIMIRLDGKFESSGIKSYWLLQILYEMNEEFDSLYSYLENRQSTRLIYLIPYKEMQGLPLHLLGYKEGVSGSKDCICSKFGISYASDCTIYKYSRSDSTSIEKFGIIADSLNGLQIENKNMSLPYASIESSTISRLAKDKGLSVKVLYGDEATLHNTKYLLPCCDYIHIACHVRFENDNPKESSILLRMPKYIDTCAKKEGIVIIQRLTLQEIWDGMDMHRCKLVNFSACKSGMSNWKGCLNDEYFGLVHGMLSAGVDTVLASVTDLNDILACLYNTLFYKHLFVDCISPILAMRSTINDLMTLSYEEAIEIVKCSDDQDINQVACLMMQSIFGYDVSTRISSIPTALADPIYWQNLRLVSVLYSKLSDDTIVKSHVGISN